MGWDIERQKICANVCNESQPALKKKKKKHTLRLNQGQANVRFLFSFITFPRVWQAAAAAVWKALCLMYTPHGKPTDYYSTSEGYEAANQMLRMSPAGITVSHICLLSVSNLCSHFAPQILLSEEDFNISKSFCGQGEFWTFRYKRRHVQQPKELDTNWNLFIDSDSADCRESVRQKITDSRAYRHEP